MATIYNNHLAQQIYSILIDYIGETIAKGSIRSQCAKLGINEEAIKVEHLNPIAEGVRRGLVLFIGTEQSMHVYNKITRCK
jgi:hypothetical protein